MADDAVAKQVLTPEGMDLLGLEAALRADFERRSVAIRRKVAELLGHPWSRDVFAALVGLDDTGRHTLLRHVVPNLTGPGTLEGLEALAQFVSYYVNDDGEVMVVPDVDEEVDSVGVAAIMGSHAAFGTDPNEDLRGWAERERPKTLVLSARDERPARGADILEAIRFNYDFVAREEAAREAAYAAFLTDDLEDDAARPAP